MTHVNRLPALVSLQHLYFQFANGETLLEDLTLSIDPTPTGIVGRNGCGKSILARLIAGELSPSCGTLDRRAIPSPASQEPLTPWRHWIVWPEAPPAWMTWRRSMNAGTSRTVCAALWIQRDCRS